MFQLLNLAATWWLQTAVLAAIGLTTAISLRKPALQSHVFRVTIVAIFLCPLATLLMSQAGMKLFTVDLQSQFLSQTTPAVNESALYHPANNSAEISVPAFSPESQHSTAEDAGDPIEALASAQPAFPEIASETTNVSTSATPVLLSSTNWLTAGAMTLLLIWITGTFVFLARLLVDLRRGQILLRQSVPADMASDQVCREIATRLQIGSPPRVVVNPFLSSPCLLGHWRPAILLPEEIKPASYDQVFLHELAHLRRSDWLWTIIGRMAQSILWCQPLVWRIHRDHMSVAEEICDDYVIEHGCDRESYLQQLIQIAELSLPQTRPVGVSMVGFRSKLGRRTARILDTTRVISTQAGRSFVAVALLAALIATTGVALVEIGQAKPIITAIADDPVAIVATVNDSKTDDSKVEANAESKQPANVARTYTGNVTAPDGRPLAGVTISAMNSTFFRDENRYRSKPLANTKSAADGSYSILYQPEDGYNHILAELSGFGPDLIHSDRLNELFQQNESQLNLRLSTEKRIAGRVVDTEGIPIEAVKVKLVEIVLPESTKAVDDWIANAKPELLKGRDSNSFISMSHDPRITETAFPGRVAINEPWDGGREIETNANGEFQWDGIGEDCLVKVKLSGPTIATREAMIVTREMPSMLAFNHSTRDHDYAHYGASPTIVASPTQLITGVVVDSASGLPLRKMNVVMTRIGKSNWRVKQIKGITDDEGTFQLSGAPLGGGHIIEVQPPIDQPYFDTSLELPLSSSTAPLQCKLELHATKWIRGRVTNEAGEPLVATLNYFPFRDNKHAEKFSNYDPKIMGRSPNGKIVSNANGEFRIQAIPGEAILAAFVTDWKEQPKYLPNRPDGLLERVGGQEMGAVLDPFSADHFDAMMEVTIDPVIDEIEQNLVFKRGGVRAIIVQDERRATVEQVSVLGRTFPPQFDLDQKLSESTLEIIGLQPDESRLVVLISSDGTSGKMLTVSGADSAAVNVQLVKCATVSGRVLDQDSDPVANMEVHIAPMQEPSQDNWGRDLGPMVTNANGEFELHLPPGGLYSVSAYTSMGPNFSVSIRPTAGATYKLGDLKDAMKLKEEATEKLKQ